MTGSDNTSPKKPTNLSIREHLLTEARSLKINLSATLEQALTERILQERRRQWLQDNRKAMETCNDLAEEHGLFSDKHRIL